jgi:hypothetical protein
MNRKIIVDTLIYSGCVFIIIGLLITLIFHNYWITNNTNKDIIMTQSRAGLRIADFLELEEDEFDIDEATEFLAAVKIELAGTLEVASTLKKLESRIKRHMLDTGEVPNVEGVEAKIMPKKEQLKLRSGALPKLYAYLQGYGIEQEDLDKFFHTVQPNPAISLMVE